MLCKCHHQEIKTFRQSSSAGLSPVHQTQPGALACREATLWEARMWPPRGTSLLCWALESGNLAGDSSLPCSLEVGNGASHLLQGRLVPEETADPQQMLLLRRGHPMRCLVALEEGSPPNWHWEHGVVARALTQWRDTAPISVTTSQGVLCRDHVDTVKSWIWDEFSRSPPALIGGNKQLPFISCMTLKAIRPLGWCFLSCHKLLLLPVL